MPIVVLHQQTREDDTPEERDVLVQRAAVVEALDRLGHEAICLGSTLNLSAVRRRLAQLRPDLVFNLVESLGGTDRLMCLATLLLDAMELPYTGSPTQALLLTTDKLLTKQRLAAAELPTPAWMANHSVAGKSSKSARGRRMVVKLVCEHASVGLGDDAVITVRDPAALGEHLRQRASASGRPYFAEEYIDGREFNVSLLAGPGGPQVLPLAEIDFSAFPPGKPRIVGYKAKWDENSFEYHHTPHRFDFDAADQPLRARLAQLARACWDLFGLRGYARVDFRVGPRGQPWILEVNANPCLSPDAGFAAALQHAGIHFDEAIQRILDDASRPLSAGHPSHALARRNNRRRAASLPSASSP
jgi:D-alanine-D-alanine ligase